MLSTSPLPYRAPSTGAARSGPHPVAAAPDETVRTGSVDALGTPRW